MTWLRSSRRAKNDRIRSTSPDAVGVSHTITAACSSEWMAWSMAGGLRYTPAPSGTGAWGPDAGGVDGYVDSGGIRATFTPMCARSNPPGYGATSRTGEHPAARASAGAASSIRRSSPDVRCTNTSIPYRAPSDATTARIQARARRPGLGRGSDEGTVRRVGDGFDGVAFCVVVLGAVVPGRRPLPRAFRDVTA